MSNGRKRDAFGAHAAREQQVQPGEGRLVPRRPDGRPPTTERREPFEGEPETAISETDISESPLGKVRFIHAGGPPTENQLSHAKGSALFVEGERLNLIWANQEDIRRLGVRFDMPEECPECGRPNDHPKM